MLSVQQDCDMHKLPCWSNLMQLAMNLSWQQRHGIVVDKHSNSATPVVADKHSKY